MAEVTLSTFSSFGCLKRLFPPRGADPFLGIFANDRKEGVKRKRVEEQT